MLKKIGEGTFLVAAVLMVLPMALHVVELLRFFLTLMVNRSYAPLFCENYPEQLKYSFFVLVSLCVIALIAVLPIVRTPTDEDEEGKS